MALLRCHACGHECELLYRGDDPECPDCESYDVQIAIPVRELPDDHPYWTDADRTGTPAAANSRKRRLQ